MKTAQHILCLTLALLTSLATVAQRGLRPRGDVNCDWTVNVGDVNAIIDAIFNDTPYHSLYTYALDINGDHDINITDLNAVIGAIMGDELPPMPTYSGTRPVLYINTDGYRDIVNKEDYLNAQWWIDAMGIDGYQSVGSAEAPLGMQIKGRGNATWHYLDKKPFRVKLDTKCSLLGMPSDRHWVLLANAEYWMGQANDAVPFEIGRRLGMAWNPRQVPVEVVLNGQYIGMYFLTEKIRVDDYRVNITKQRDNETDSALITGGWLLEIDNYKEPGNITLAEGNGEPFWVTPHAPEVLNDVQREYITRFLANADSAIYTPDKSSTTWEKYIDIDALAIYYLVQEVIDNPEAFSGSCYMHKDRGDSTRLVFGPLWDCGSSFQRYSKDYKFDSFIYENMPAYCRSRWIGEIAKFPRFQECVRKHWQRFYTEVYPSLDPFLDKFATAIETAGEHDHVRWPQFNGNGTTQRINTFLKPCLNKKVAWLQSQWGEEQ